MERSNTEQLERMAAAQKIKNELEHLRALSTTAGCFSVNLAITIALAEADLQIARSNRAASSSQT